jgi:hypothetical protein
MNALEAVSERLRRNDMLQALALFLVAMGFVLATRWPGAAGAPNASWFLLAQVRNTLLVLAGLGFGAASSQASARERGLTLAGLLVFVAVSGAFDVATYAATFPALPLAYAAALPYPETIAAYGVGLVLGRGTAVLRVRGLLPLLVPAVVALGAYLDVRWHTVVFNPALAATRVAPVHLAAVGVAALITAGAVVRSWRAAREGAP